MIIIDGYSIQQYPKENRIVIGLPQTVRTCTNTVGQIADRRDVLSQNELIGILSLTKSYYQMEQLKEQK